MTTNDSPQDLRSYLRIGACTVVFLKKDGTLRTMMCTLKPDMIPLTEQVTSKTGSSASDPNLFRVFDIQKGEWRSFRMDQVLNYTWNFKLHGIPVIGSATTSTWPAELAKTQEPKAAKATDIPITAQIAFGFKPSTAPAVKVPAAPKKAALAPKHASKAVEPAHTFVNRFGQTIYPGDRVVVFATCQNTSRKQYLGEYVGMSPGASPQVKVFAGQSWSTRTYPNGSVYKLADN